MERGKDGLRPLGVGKCNFIMRWFLFIFELLVDLGTGGIAWKNRVAQDSNM